MLNTYPSFTLSNTLTEEQLDFFNKNGFIHFKNFLKPATVDAFVQASKEVEQKWISEGVKKVNGVPIKYGIDLNGKPIVQRFAFINQHHTVFSSFLQEDVRLQSLLGFIGEGARIGDKEKDGMVFNHYVNGPQSKFTRMGWHTDGLRDIFLGQKLSPMLNVGIHLSNLKPENGGLRLIPGTHNQSLFNFLFRKKYFIDNNPDAEEVAILPAAGDLTVHDGRLWHRVAQSTITGETSRRRVIYIPLTAGKYAPKNENSATPVYQRFAALAK
jgi:ectoine hydroxylase-related dioxygenase (phytanoyl-CoA dioxygenase family)